MAEKNPIVTFELENGDVMKAELYPDVAGDEHRAGAQPVRLLGGQCRPHL